MNVSIAVYATATGELIRFCSVPEDDAPLQAQEGESIILIEDVGVISDMSSGNYKSYWAGGGVVKLLPPKPSADYVFDYSLKQWVFSLTLQDVKNAKWEYIKKRRTEVIDANLVTPYGDVDSGSADRVNITNAVMMLQTLAGIGTPGTVQFTMADNSTVELDVTKMVHIGLLLGQKIEVAHATARSYRVAIDAAQTIEEVSAITWS